MSVEFSNVYQEVLLENLDAILKQNLLFQARLKLLEREANVRAEMQAKIDDLTVNIQQLTEQLDSTQHYKTQAENNDAIVQEKTRIQSALNDSMRELAGVKADLEARRNEVSSLNGIVSSKDGEIQNLKSSKDGEIQNLKSSKDTEIQNLRLDKDAEIQNLRLDKDAEIQNLKTAKDAEIQNMQSAKDAEIERLKTELSDLQKLVPVVQAAKVVKKTTVKTEEKPVEISATETNKTRVEVGGTF
jgi:DNA repair exonuclease SbcCD ATPase subunit